MRARSVKPGLFKNELLGSSDPLYTVIFEGLWCIADRSGRLEDRPPRIHAEINPYRAVPSTVLALDWLCSNGFIQRYDWEGLPLIQIVNFDRHQNPHVREAQSLLPSERQIRLFPERHRRLAPVEHPASTGLARLTPDSPFLTPDSLYTGNPSADTDGKNGEWELPLDEFPNLNREAMAEYRAYRQERKLADLKPRSLRALCAYLAGFDAPTQAAMVEQSVRHGWQGIFDLKATGALNGSGGALPKVKAKTADQLEAEALARGEAI